jgi:gliding motility-associated-like protein
MNDMTLPVYDDFGNGANTKGELLNQTHATAGTPGNFWPMGAAGSGSGDRTFYVRARRYAYAPGVPGVDCKTAVVQVTILDQHLSPNMSLSPVFNSFCTATALNGVQGDGIINITADADPNTGGNQNSVLGFSYAWTNANAGLSSPQSATNIFAIPKLGTGSYQVTATNLSNSCTVVNTATINPAPYVINVISSTTTDQRICANDGQIDLTNITVDESAAGTPNIVETNATPLTLNYDFKWYKANPATPGTFNSAPGQELADTPGPTPINNQSLIAGSGAGQYAAMGVGTYYVVATRKATAAVAAGCPAQPYRVDIKDVHQNPSPTLTALSNTSCLPGTDEGEIIINITDATNASFKPPGGFTYSYVWSGGAPSTLPANGQGNGNGVNGDFAGDVDHFTALLDNPAPYAVVITNNQSLCTVNASATIVKNATPVFVQSVTVVDQVLCAADGSLTVAQVSLNDRAGMSQTFPPNISDFNFNWTRSASAFTQTTAGTLLDNSTYNTAGFGVPLGADTYTVVAKRTTGSPGAGCSSAPFTVTMANKQIFPVVALTPLANTSCNPAFYEGEIKVVVTDGSVNLPAPLPGAPFLYDYTWPTTVTAIAPTTNNNGDGYGGGDLNASNVVDNDGDHPKNLQEGGYSISVKNQQTGCISTASTTLFKNGTPVFTQLVQATPQVLCSADGKLEVKEVQLIDRNGVVHSNLSAPPNNLSLSDFDFDWQDATGALIKTTLGANGAVSGGTILDNNAVTGYPAIGAGTYYVVTRRVSGSPGQDCASAPYKVDILNKQVFPVVALTPLSNTSCNPAFFEGEIKVIVTDASVNLPAPLPGAPFLYNYTWTSAVTAIAPSTNNNGDGYGSGDLNASNVVDNDGDHPKGLQEGPYAISVTNTQTGCASPASTTIFRNGTPIFTQLVTTLPQVLCTPDGSLQVKEVKIIDRNGVTQSNLNTPPDFALTDFVFTYDRVISGTTTNVLTNSPDAFLDNTNYNVPAIPPGVGFGTYYVTTTRKIGFPGNGCASAPYEVVIDDQRLFPKLAFTSIANSSCNVAKPNGSITAAASEQNGTNTDPYTFSWTLNGTPIASVVPTPPTQTDTSPNSVITNALDGAYIATVTNTNTGCPFAGSFNLQLDQTRSTPNIIDVTTVDPLDCNPSASATVTKITLGSTYNSTTQPPNIPPNNAITGPALAGFIYTWAAGNPGNVIAGQTAPMLNGIKSGAYFVSVKDPNTDCQSGPKEADISNINIIYPVVNIAQTAKQISCLATTGTAALSASAAEQDGTTGSYQFTWYPTIDTTGVALTPPTAPSTTNNPNALVNLLAGNYSVKVQNTVSSCKAMALFIVPNDAPTFTPVISGTADPLTLCVGVDGDAEVRVIPDPNYPNPPSYNYKADLYFGGSPNFGNPPDVPNVPSIPGPIPGVALVFQETGLNLGLYTFLVTDNNTGCTTSVTVEVKDGRTNPVIVIVQDNPMTNCDPAIADGQLSATADNGKIQGYLFDWYAGTSVTNPASPLQVDNKLIGEVAGSYTVRVTNNLTQCFADMTGTITDGTVLPPIPTAIVVADRTNCITPNGEVSATVGGATLNYNFDWYNGPATKPTSDYQFPDYSGLDIGPYTVTATDVVTHCVSPPATVTVQDKRVMPDFDLSSTPSYCIDVGKPKGNGSVTLTLKSPGMVLSDISWTDLTTNAPVGIGPQVFELFPGIYGVKAVSTDGCETDGTVTLGTEINPYNGISANGDGQNDNFIIDCISNFPNNNVKIFNRYGIKVYEADGYNNGLISFRGIGEEGIYLGSKELPVGTYFYIVDKRDGSKPKSGYLELNR